MTPNSKPRIFKSQHFFLLVYDPVWTKDARYWPVLQRTCLELFWTLEKFLPGSSRHQNECNVLPMTACGRVQLRSVNPSSPFEFLACTLPEMLGLPMSAAVFLLASRSSLSYNREHICFEPTSHFCCLFNDELQKLHKSFFFNEISWKTSDASLGAHSTKNWEVQTC